ncbi:MAG: hypothetical protein COU29_03210 [Candidatus Magasanikbacteria bacterium CG10_big_fil_rev_8_21_14_0_10_36_32]|uniref:Uncharacterized protein n=1 Tax=Candidatus Magasanikbacteria bacterium CG10_big_fil_rev_8_21_14_0_10_36_32 TaxID=1974646 RepID=A0A2M6W620_9BACT|nr:MAG: hypothetical protein COU29_03210 [Candidatus Magasanikbacteria bacterium CG10_big_fil_rev_8_21_14_0_10_36_32]
MPEQIADLAQRIEVIKSERNPLNKYREYIKLIQSELSEEDSTLVTINPDELTQTELDIWNEFFNLIGKIDKNAFENRRDELIVEADVLLNKVNADGVNKSFVEWMRNRLTILVSALPIKNFTWDNENGRGFGQLLEKQKERLFYNDFKN